VFPSCPRVVGVLPPSSGIHWCRRYPSLIIQGQPQLRRDAHAPELGAEPVAGKALQMLVATFGAKARPDGLGIGWLEVTGCGG